MGDTGFVLKRTHRPNHSEYPMDFFNLGYIPRVDNWPLETQPICGEDFLQKAKLDKFIPQWWSFKTEFFKLYLS